MPAGRPRQLALNLASKADLVNTSLYTVLLPGVATLDRLDPECAGLRISHDAQSPTSDAALIICRGFAGTNAALIVRAR